MYLQRPWSRKLKTKQSLLKMSTRISSSMFYRSPFHAQAKLMLLPLQSSIPYGLLVWATGNTARPLVKSMISQIGEKVQNQRRGLVVDDTLKVAGAEDVWACGDCTAT